MQKDRAPQLTCFVRRHSGEWLIAKSKAEHEEVNKFAEGDRREISTENKEARMFIRNETRQDIDAISEVTEAAFRTLQISQHTEQFIIKALREANALSVSLVAEIDGHVVGHIAFSPVTISDGSQDWYGLGPVSVLPGYQKQGIGGSLVNEGLSSLKALGGKGCVLVGDPAFYQRFGFRNFPTLILPDIPQEYFLALPLDDEVPRGTVVFHDGFRANTD